MFIRFDQRFFSRSQESWDGISVDNLAEFIVCKCKEMISLSELKSRLSTGKKLRIKFGIDPTASDIHLGHIVPILLLKQFAKAGHHIDFIIGGFTARIGDPSWRETSRTPLTAAMIDSNLSTYRNQVSKYIDTSLLNIHNNSDWIEKLGMREFFEFLQSVNLAEAIQREDFRSRMGSQHGVSLAETCYGILMGIDSVVLKSDIEIGGIDQLLNFQQCRSVMQFKGLNPEVILMTPILEGVSGDGRKMSKSFKNYIAVNDSKKDKFGKIMSIPDTLILPYFKAFADILNSELEELQLFIAEHPMEAKKQLASLIVALESTLDDGLAERESFERMFSKKTIDETEFINLPFVTNITVFDFLFASKVFASKSELRRLFEQNGVRLFNGDGTEDETILKLDSQIKLGDKIKVGKRKYFKATL